MTPEEYVSTLKPPNRAPGVVGNYWGQELGLSPAPNDVERWRRKGVQLADDEVFPYGLIVETAVPQITMTPETADTFLATVGRLESRVNAAVTPEIAAAAAVQIFGQEKRSQHLPPLDPSRATIVNWALGLIPDAEQRITAVKAGLDVAPRSLSTGKFTKSTPALLELIEDPAVREAAQGYAAERPTVSRTEVERQRNQKLGRSALDRGDPTTGVPKQPRRRF